MSKMNFTGLRSRSAGLFSSGGSGREFIASPALSSHSLAHNHITFFPSPSIIPSPLPTWVPCLPFIRTLGITLGPPRQSRSISPAQEPEFHHSCKRLPFCLSYKATPFHETGCGHLRGPFIQPVTTCQRWNSSPLQNPAYPKSSSLILLTSLPIAANQWHNWLIADVI